MEFEYWWLLGFPLFFGLGWLAARIDIRHLVYQSRALPRSYFKGLNFLLNEQPDKAIESFIEVVKVDPETVELHFALGSLFRRRGEYDRAIRMHQNLIERPDLAAEQRTAALFELAQDYLKAGILDRAEELFGRLEKGPHATEARRHLLEIYQQEKEWQQGDRHGAAPGGRIGRVAREGDRPVPVRAGRHREHAFAPRRGAATPRVGAGGEPQVGARQRAAGRPRARGGPPRARDRALEADRGAESRLPRAGGAAPAGRAPRGGAAGGGPDAAHGLPRALSLARPARHGVPVHAGGEGRGGGLQAGARRAAPQPDAARAGPAARGADRGRRAPGAAARSRAGEETSCTAIHSRLARYRCENCGFKARQFYWHCPACGGWETYPPRRTEEFDLAP